MSPSLQLGAVAVGQLPRVVGTIVTTDYLAAPLPPEGYACDLVEVRLDHLWGCRDWLDHAQRIESSGKPVLMTLRSNLEGGAYRGPDSDRLPYIHQALESLSAVDIELQSSIAPEVAAAARKAGKPCVISFHDFAKTPPNDELHELIHRGEDLGGIVKISAMARSEEDVARLRALLDRPRKHPLCVIAMGALGTSTRVSFATAGSCLTYGYLDQPGAPGQLSAAELVLRISECSAAYAAEHPGQAPGVR